LAICFPQGTGSEPDNRGENGSKTPFLSEIDASRHQIDRGWASIWSPNASMTNAQGINNHPFSINDHALGYQQPRFFDQ
jgi:hypothetical protein